MYICRIIGWFLLLLALGAVGHEVILWLSVDKYRVIAMGELWYKIDAPSLANSQAVVQRYLSAWLWQHAISEVLRWPAWAVFGSPGLILSWYCRPRGRSRIF